MTATESAVVCDQPDCQFAATGICRDGIPPESCPNTSSADAQMEEPDEEAAATEPEEPASLERTPEARADDGVDLGGDQSLSLHEADSLAHQYGATVVLVAGEEKSGKTTLLVELFARFLHGRFDGYAFAGSATLDAFDARHFEARVKSGHSHPTTKRTQEEDMRLLHLRLVKSAEQRALMLTDVKGETFEEVMHGQPVGVQIPIAPRVDKAIVLVDGRKVRDPQVRQIVIRNARTLIGGLFGTAEGLRKGTPVMIVVTKTDLLGPAELAWFDDNVRSVVELAANRGAGPVELHRLAARPHEDPEAPIGLEVILRWIWEDDAPRATVPTSARPDDRVFWNAVIGE